VSGFRTSTPTHGASAGSAGALKRLAGPSYTPSTATEHPVATWSGGVVTALLNPRLMAGGPPGWVATPHPRHAKVRELADRPAGRRWRALVRRLHVQRRGSFRDGQAEKTIPAAKRANEGINQSRCTVVQVNMTEVVVI
jgi:hypothetical protein